ATAVDCSRPSVARGEGNALRQSLLRRKLHPVIGREAFRLGQPDCADVRKRTAGLHVPRTRGWLVVVTESVQARRLGSHVPRLDDQTLGQRMLDMEIP